MFKITFLSIWACFYGLRFNESPVTDVGFVEDSLVGGRRRRRRKSDDGGAWDSGRANYIIKFSGTASTDAKKIKAFEDAMADCVAKAAFGRFKEYASLTDDEAGILALVKANIDVRPIGAPSLLDFSVLVTWDENSNWATSSPVLPALLDQIFKVPEFRTDFNTKIHNVRTSTPFQEYGITGFTNGDAVERTYSWTKVEATVAVKLSYAEPAGNQFGLVTSDELDTDAGFSAGAGFVLNTNLQLGLQKGTQLDLGYLEILSKAQAAQTCTYYFSFVVDVTGNQKNGPEAVAVVGSGCTRLNADKGFKAVFQNAAASTFGVAANHLTISVRCTSPAGDQLWAADHAITVDFKYTAPCKDLDDPEPKSIHDRMNKCAASAEGRTDLHKCWPDGTIDSADDDDNDGSDDEMVVTEADIISTLAKQNPETKAIITKAKGTYTIANEVDVDGVVVTGRDITVKAWNSVPSFGGATVPLTGSFDDSRSKGTAKPMTLEGKVADIYLVNYRVAVRNDQSSEAIVVMGDMMKKHTAGMAEAEGWTDFKTGVTDSGQLKLRGITVESCVAMGAATLETAIN